MLTQWTGPSEGLKDEPRYVSSLPVICRQLTRLYALDT
jgi:hypothetical protein